MIKVKVGDVVRMLKGKCEVKGNPNAFFTEVKPIGEESKDSLIWISPEKKEKEKIINRTAAKVIICDKGLMNKTLPEDKTYIFTSNPRFVFSRILRNYFAVEKKKGIHESAYIHSEAKIGRNCFVGPSTIIGQCVIGENCHISGNVTLYDNVKIGNNCTIHSGTIIGVDGFGFEENEKGEYEPMEHIGGVDIGKNVIIYANVSIARGSLSCTKILDGVYINNNAHLAHNVVINKDVVIAANAAICGSAHIGRKAWIGPGAIVRGGVYVGENSTLGMGAVLTRDLPEGQVWIGNPAKEK
jgi:UDP-3-O-[3-hydroxymyristoyl] glucosamine N-acyltransferase